MQIAQPTERPHRNHGLFSDHYLNVTLPERAEWRALVEEARSAMEGISQVFSSYVPSDNEAQTEKDLVRPVLKLLGHDYEGQPALATPAGAKRPDYIFYRGEAALNAKAERRRTHGGVRGASQPRQAGVPRLPGDHLLGRIEATRPGRGPRRRGSGPLCRLVE